jgi:hypothetical protein
VVSVEAAPRLTPAAKIRLAGEILATYVRVRWAMRRHDLEDVVGRLRSVRPTDGPLPHERRVQLAGALIGVLSVVPTDSRCLVRSLVYIAMLGRRGVSGELIIGVRTEPEFAAHAWVECEGRPLLPTGDGYARLTTI